MSRRARGNAALRRRDAKGPIARTKAYGTTVKNKNTAKMTRCTMP
jgi:hypothetical protein